MPLNGAFFKIFCKILTFKIFNPRFYIVFGKIMLFYCYADYLRLNPGIGTFSAITTAPI